MNLLLDTHLLLWAASEPERLSVTARNLILDTTNRLHFSAASLCEIGIKCSLGRKDFQVDPRRFWRMLQSHGYRELSVHAEHALLASELPLLHKDPFDRILVAQSRIESFKLITADTTVAAYGVDVMLV